MVTINDVAREAGVSPATVSRVINNSLVVSAGKRQHVLDAIEKLGYEIPARSSGSGKLVLVITDSADPDTNNHLYHSLSALGYQMFVFYFCESPDTQSDLLSFLKTMPLQQIAGIILCNFVRKIDEPLTRLLDEFPVVQIGSSIPFSRTSLIRKNDFQSAHDLTTHLIRKGCKRIATFSHDSSNLSNLLHASERESIYGYMAALFDAGIVTDQSLIIESDSTIEGSYEAVSSYLDAHPDDHADAFLCLLDTMALGTERALQERGIRIPDDVRIASLLGSWISRFAYPSLTSLNSPNEDLAKEAVRQLHMLITDPQPVNRTISIPFQITYRESTEGFEP